MNQKIKVTMYSPVHEALGEQEYTVTGLKFNKENGSVTIQMADTSFDITLDELAGEGKHDTISNQILAELKENEMSDEEKAARSAIGRGIDSIVHNRALESWSPQGERRT